MSIQFYHPSKSGSGFAASFSLKDSSISSMIVKQSGWDENSQTGTFKASASDPLKRANIKFSLVEVAAIINSIERNRPFKTFHDNEETPKTIVFAPWVKDEVQKGFSFSVTVGSKTDPKFSNSFFIGLTMDEARLVREFFVWGLHRAFEVKQTYVKPQAREEAPVQPEQEAASSVDPLTGI